MVTCFSFSRTSAPFLPAGAALFALLLFVGCDRDEIKTYRVAKEQPVKPAAISEPTTIPHGHPTVAQSRPQLKWDLPAEWKEAPPGQMSLATFNIEGKEGQRAQVTVTPLPNMA